MLLAQIIDIQWVQPKRQGEPLSRLQFLRFPRFTVLAKKSPPRRRFARLITFSRHNILTYLKRQFVDISMFDDAYNFNQLKIVIIFNIFSLYFEKQ